MPPPYGLNSTGFNVKRVTEIQAEINDALRAEFGQNFDVSAASPQGQLTGVYSDREASIWELLEQVHQAKNLLNASGADLDDVVSLAAVQRLPATSTTVVLVPAGTGGTIIPAGSVVSLTPGTGQRFVTLAGTTIPNPVSVAAESTGPIVVLASSTWAIETPITGWTGVSNALDGETGRNVESDNALRLRYVQAIAGPGNSLDSLWGALVRITGVAEVVVTENPLYVTDAAGRPPKSFEVVIDGGDDTEIAQAIWDNKPVGIETYGVTTTESITDAVGNAHDVNFSRPSDLNIWIELDYEPNGEFPVDGEDQILAAILSYEDTVRIDRDFMSWHVLRLIEVAGIDSLSIRVGLTASPSSDLPITVSPRQRAALDSSRILISRV